MRNAKWILGAVALSVLLIASSTPAAVSFWITDASDGSTTPASISFTPGETKTLYLYMNGGGVSGLVFEGMLCYDLSTVQGSFGKDVGAGSTGKLTLGTVTINTSFFPSISGVSPTFQANATAREASNSFFGGRPYGKQIIGGLRPAVIPGTTQKVAEFSVTNNMAAGQSYGIYLSDAGDGKSYTTQWKTASATARAATGVVISSASAGIPGDFNGDSVLDGYDIDMLYDVVWGRATGGSQYDLNGDSAVDQGDVEYFVYTLKSSEYGDADLGGVADGDDYNNWFFGFENGIQGDMSRWFVGDFDGSGAVDGDDYNYWFYGFEN